MFRRRKANLNCETQTESDEVICFNDRATRELSKDYSEYTDNGIDNGTDHKVTRRHKLLQSIINRAGRPYSPSGSLSPSSVKSLSSPNGSRVFSPSGARTQRAGSFMKLSGILGPEVLDDIQNLRDDNLPEIN